MDENIYDDLDDFINSDELPGLSHKQVFVMYEGAYDRLASKVGELEQELAHTEIARDSYKLACEQYAPAAAADIAASIKKLETYRESGRGK